MIADDYEKFIMAWSTMIELQAGKDLSDRALRLAFDLLLEYDLGEVKAALRLHCLKSPYIAKPADIVAIVRGVIPSNTELFGLAQQPDTILGAYVRHLVGGHDIDRLSGRDASARVSSHRRRIESFIDRVQQGIITNDEIRVIGGKGFDVCDVLCPGLPGPRIIFWERLRALQADIVKIQIADDSEIAAGPIAKQRSPEDTEAGKQRLRGLMEKLKATPEQVQP